MTTAQPSPRRRGRTVLMGAGALSAASVVGVGIAYSGIADAAGHAPGVAPIHSVEAAKSAVRAPATANARPVRLGSKAEIARLKNRLAHAQGAAARREAIIQLKSYAVRNATPATTADDSADQMTPGQQEFFSKGYDWDDATKLASMWNMTDIGQVKTKAGNELLAGQTLPVAPSGTPEADNTTDDRYVNDFFNAGYTYDDAVRLGQMWNESSYQAKVDGGRKIDAGETLPIAP